MQLRNKTSAPRINTAPFISLTKKDNQNCQNFTTKVKIKAKNAVRRGNQVLMETQGGSISSQSQLGITSYHKHTTPSAARSTLLQRLIIGHWAWKMLPS